MLSNEASLASLLGLHRLSHHSSDLELHSVFDTDQSNASRYQKFDLRRNMATQEIYLAH